MGGKFRIRKPITKIINQCIDITGANTYYEPFIGGLNITPLVQCENVIANDLDYEVIALYQAVQDGQELPEHISRDEYMKVKRNRWIYPLWYRGFVGSIAFGGNRWAGYANNHSSRPNLDQTEMFRRLVKIAVTACNYTTNFITGSYDVIQVNNAVIYCDPPYKDTKQYKNVAPFNHDTFYAWCHEQVNEFNNTILLSEYNPPEGFKVVWSKEKSVGLTAGKHGKGIKKLETLSILTNDTRLDKIDSNEQLQLF